MGEKMLKKMNNRDELNKETKRARMGIRKKGCLRILAVMLSFCVLLTSSPRIWEAVSVFAAEESDGEGRQYISGFAALPEEIREQSVPLGTGLQELSLPDALEAYISAKNAGNSGGGVKLPGIRRTVMTSQIRQATRAESQRTAKM